MYRARRGLDAVGERFQTNAGDMYRPPPRTAMATKASAWAEPSTWEPGRADAPRCRGRIMAPRVVGLGQVTGGGRRRSWNMQCDRDASA